MTRSRFGLLGLCAVVFGLMAFGVSAVQAEPGAQWLLAKLNGEKVELISFLPATLGLETDTLTVWHSKIGGVSVLFECTTMAAVNAKLLANGAIGEKEGAVKGSKLRFSGCITKLNGVTSAPCEPVAGGTEKGVVNTNALHALIVLHKLEPSGVKDELIQILPDVGNTFLTREMGEECAIGTKIPVIGKLFFRDCENAFLTHKLKHLWEVDHTTTNLTKLFVISETAEHVLTLLGSWWARLLGEHAGLHFSGDPA